MYSLFKKKIIYQASSYYNYHPAFTCNLKEILLELSTIFVKLIDIGLVGTSYTLSQDNLKTINIENC